MKLLSIFVCFILSGIQLLYAEVTEEDYIDYNVKVQTIGRDYRNDPAAMMEEMEKLNKEYSVDSQEWQDYNRKIQSDPASGASIWKKIYERLEKEGYNKTEPTFHK